jgi:HEXXH motif-containing protein
MDTDGTDTDDLNSGGTDSDGMNSDGSRPGVTRHRLSAASFSTLSAGDGSPEITRGFWDTEESRRLLLVSTLLTEMTAAPESLGPLSPVGEVVAVLTEAQKAAPDAVRDLLLDPNVGGGCAYALRRLRGGASSDSPLWIDLGVVHALTLAAAARAGLSWSTRLPLRDGNTMIPTRGMARFPASTTAAFVDAHTAGGDVRLSDGRVELTIPAGESDVEFADGRAGWWALRRVRAGGDLPLTVWLDDLGPLRDLADPVPPARLDAAAFQRWSTLISDAWTLLCRDYRTEAEAMADGVVSIVPLTPEPGWDTRSASNGEAFGSVMLDEPPDAVTLAVALIHEYQHIKLGALLHLIRVTEPDSGSLYYAPWRDDPRPLPGLIQGVYAFFGIAKFWRTRRVTATGDDRAVAAFEYAYARRQTAESVQIVLAAPGLTDQGRQLFVKLAQRLEDWSHEPADAVDPRIVELAALTADSHRIGWRLRHFRPPVEEVAVLAGQWAQREEARESILARAVIRPHAALRWEQRIPAVARERVLGRREGDQAAPPDELATGENALIARDARTARAAFASAVRSFAPIGRDPERDVPDDEARAWAGLAMSLAADGDTAAALALSRRPDLVRALYAESGSEADPADVAAWLAPAILQGERPGRD